MHRTAQGQTADEGERERLAQRTHSEGVGRPQ